MTAFDRAWNLVKMPIYNPYEVNTDDWHDNAENYKFDVINIAEDRIMGHGDYNPRLWESEHGDAQGYAGYIDEDDDPELGPYLQMVLFQMANDKRGKGLSRDRLNEMITELKEYDGDDLPIRVTNIENDTVDYWNKLVDEGMIDSASQKPWVATDPKGKIHPKIEKEFRYLRRFPDMLTVGGYDPNNDEAFVNLGGLTWDDPSWGGKTDEDEMIRRIIQVLAHEQAHQALSPPHSDDLWEYARFKGELPEGMSDSEIEEMRRELQRGVDRRWTSAQEYAAHAAEAHTMGATPEQRFDKLNKYPDSDVGDILDLARNPEQTGSVHWSFEESMGRRARQNAKNRILGKQ